MQEETCPKICAKPVADVFLFLETFHDEDGPSIFNEFRPAEGIYSNQITNNQIFRPPTKNNGANKNVLEDYIDRLCKATEQINSKEHDKNVQDCGVCGNDCKNCGGEGQKETEIKKEIREKMVVVKCRRQKIG